ncbi:MAG: YbfB/YjiJ family MFS transporter [Syntrophales bacterium]|nr:YbfB/YjiJ family MFS transporter [Syntrophales bacterium]MDP3096640.1 YbfB/YjiJ family MFS transporter [Syntrophales bacterium]
MNVKEFIQLNSFALDTRANPLYTFSPKQPVLNVPGKSWKTGRGIRFEKIEISLRVDRCRRRDDRGHGGAGAGLLCLRIFLYCLCHFFLRPCDQSGESHPGRGRQDLVPGRLCEPGKRSYLGGRLRLDSSPCRLAIVFCLHTFSFSLFAFSTTVVGFYVSALAFGVSAWSIPSIVAAFSGDIAGARLAPAALGMVTVIFGTGQALAPYVAGKLADASGSFSYPFMLAALVALAGAIGSLFLNKSEKNI